MKWSDVKPLGHSTRISKAVIGIHSQTPKGVSTAVNLSSHSVEHRYTFQITQESQKTRQGTLISRSGIYELTGMNVSGGGRVGRAKLTKWEKKCWRCKEILAGHSRCKFCNILTHGVDDCGTCMDMREWGNVLGIFDKPSGCPG